MTVLKMNAVRAARFRQLAFEIFIFERILRHVNITFFTSDTYQKKEKSFLFFFGYFSFFCKLKITAENPILLKKRALKNLKS